MDLIVNSVREFFASPVLVSSNASTTIQHPPAATSPSSSHATGIVSSTTTNTQTRVASSTATRRDVLARIVTVARALLQWVSQNRRVVWIAIAASLAVAAISKLISKYKLRRRNTVTWKVAKRCEGSVSPASILDSDSVSSIATAVLDRLTPTPSPPSDFVEVGKMNSQGTAASGSSSRATPSKRLQYRNALSGELLPEGVSERVTRDGFGKLVLLTRNGDYVEVWEADEYGQPITRGGTFDADAQCEELLGHFCREASLQQVEGGDDDDERVQ